MDVINSNIEIYHETMLCLKYLVDASATLVQCSHSLKPVEASAKVIVNQCDASIIRHHRILRKRERLLTKMRLNYLKVNFYSCLRRNPLVRVHRRFNIGLNSRQMVDLNFKWLGPIVKTNRGRLKLMMDDCPVFVAPISTIVRVNYYVAFLFFRAMMIIRHRSMQQTIDCEKDEAGIRSNVSESHVDDETQTQVESPFSKLDQIHGN